MVRSLADRARRLAARFARAEHGATAVEFALVSIPFMVLIFAIIELGLVFLVSLTLENAIVDVGRTIRTGQVQTTGGTAASFKAAVCNKIGWLGGDCDGALSIDVRTFPDYTTGATATAPTTMSWTPGGAGSTVLIRAYYTWPLVTPLLRTGLQDVSGKRVIYAATAFTNEPYQ
ncbi:TadE/TadG family type IV pilus assembly protein [Caulobacter sp. RL271]|jgi:Flp pilus assembly protein TadG|uniref:Pilus assembly protein n=1 Tax=Caulobacter segnis TaxID=88688 RepID=A0ABY4ZQB2_9CAUL|nr:TadE/TadG family type IV pilus assembly protein [Caulobacter segnis]USQ94972.1 pilus assembly protein [Caulobacter segnis]